MAQLMFKIANEAHPDIRSIHVDLPENLVAIIDKALTKDPDQRYQPGAEFARDLRICLAMMGSTGTSNSSGLDISI